MRKQNSRAPKRSGSDASMPSTPGASDRLTGWSTLFLGITISTLLLWKNGGWELFRCSTPMSVVEFNLFNICMLLLPTFFWILVVLRRELSEFGLTPGNARGAVIFSLIVGVAYIPVLALFSGQKAFQSYYINVLMSDRVLTNVTWTAGKYTGGQIDYGRFTQHELMMCLYMLAWEWFFRGYLLFGLRKVMPVWAAATSRSVWRERKAGICSTSTARAASAHCSGR